MVAGDRFLNLQSWMKISCKSKALSVVILLPPNELRFSR
jgi:hypothetical protein